jgi:hypothetical protein
VERRKTNKTHKSNVACLVSEFAERDIEAHNNDIEDECNFYYWMSLNTCLLVQMFAHSGAAPPMMNELSVELRFGQLSGRLAVSCVFQAVVNLVWRAELLASHRLLIRPRASQRKA